MNRVKGALFLIWTTPQRLLMLFIRIWRLVLSPLYGPTCKYYPSCSAYGLGAIEQHGVVRGSCLTGWRLLRCNPFSHGGVDEVPVAGQPSAIMRWLTQELPGGQTESTSFVDQPQHLSSVAGSTEAKCLSDHASPATPKAGQGCAA